MVKPGLANGADLVEAELAGENGAAETDLLQERDLGGRVVVHLCVLAMKGSGGRSHSSRPVSWMIRPSAPISWSCQASRSASPSSLSVRIVLMVT